MEKVLQAVGPMCLEQAAGEGLTGGSPGLGVLLGSTFCGEG